MTAKRANNITLLIVLITVVVAMTVAMPDQFLRLGNLQNMMRNLPEYALLAFGIMIAMTIGGIDLSGVSVLSLSGVVAAMILSNHQEIALPTVVTMILAILAALGTAALCGLINGLIISLASVPAIIATLGTNGLYYGLAIGITKGSHLGGFPLPYVRIANSDFLGIPIPFWVFIAIALLLGLLLDKTTLGFQMKMLGASPVAARFSGMRNRAVLLKSFMIISLLAGVSAVLLTSKVATMRPNYGQDYLLLAVLLSILGGTNPDGGFSSVLGVFLAILALQVLATGSTFLGFTPFFRNFLYGLLLLAVMVIHHYRDTGAWTTLAESLRTRMGRSG